MANIKNQPDQIRHGFPAWRVFIFGVEISDDVSSCTTSWGDSARSPGVAEIVLSSPLDRYITTVSDIHAMYDDIPKEALNSYQNGFNSDYESVEFAALEDRISRAVIDPIKRLIIQKKILIRVQDVTQSPFAGGLSQDVKQPTLGVTSNKTTKDSPLYDAPFNGEVPRYPFSVGQCVFHTGDPVTIFWRDPFNPGDWYWAGRGTVSDWKESIQPSGLRTVTITMEDSLRSLRLARVALNPALYDIDVVTDPQFDDVIRNWHTNIFDEKTLPEMIYALLFGEGVNQPDVIKKLQPLSQFRYGAYGDPTSIMNVPVDGGGLYNSADTEFYIYGSPSDQSVQTSAVGKEFQNVSTLEEWQSIVDNKVSTDIDDLMTLCIPNAKENAEERAFLQNILSRSYDYVAVDNTNTLIGQIIQRIGEHPELYPVDYGRLLMLMPASLGPNSNRDIMQKDIATGVSSTTETMTRLQIGYNVCERIDFSFYATPRGDIVCEMPLYSFNPEDFGVYADRYRFSIADTISLDSHFEHDKIRTMFTCDYYIIPDQQSGGTNQQVWQQPGIRYLKGLIPQFGIRSDRVDPWGYIDTEAAASYYAQLMLTKANANAWMQDVSCLMHIGIGPNRPCYFEIRDFIATVRNVNNSIVWGTGGSVGQKMTLNYRRGWSGLVDSTDPTKHFYEPFGGYMSQTINYALLFAQHSPSTSTKKLAHLHSIQINEFLPRQIQENLAKVKAKIRSILDVLGNNMHPPRVLPDDFLNISSDFRSPEDNKKAKGKKRSLHLSGLAADIGLNSSAANLANAGLTRQDLLNAVYAATDPAHDSVILEKGDNPVSSLDAADHIHVGVGELKGPNQ